MECLCCILSQLLSEMCLFKCFSSCNSVDLNSLCSDVLPDFPVRGYEYYMLFLFVSLDMVIEIE